MDNHNTDDENAKRPECAACQRELRMGDDAIALQRGVHGPRGFVRLGEKTYLCDHVCLARYCNGSANGVEKMPRRVP